MSLACKFLVYMQTALKLINTALQKHKDNQLLRVLKALALNRVDKADQACKVSAQPIHKTHLFPLSMPAPRRKAVVATDSLRRAAVRAHKTPTGHHVQVDETLQGMSIFHHAGV